jgi:hypothetical protein
MSTRLVIVAALLALAACSSPTGPGSDLATGTVGSPSGGPGHKVPMTRPCQTARCKVRLQLDSRPLGAPAALRPDSGAR